MGGIKKYEYIDSLRGVAILLVINVHIWMDNIDIMSYLPGTVDHFMQIGRYGVQLFFVVSSCTLMMSYHSRKNEEHATRNFFIRRIFRIIPMYYLAILFYTFALFVGFDIHSMDFSNVPLKGLFTNIFMIHGLFPAWTNGYVPGGWTVSAEFLFYLSLPFLCMFITNITRSLWLFFGSLVISHIVHLLLVGSSYNVYDYAYFNIFNHIPAFTLGMLGYWLIKDGMGILTKNPINLAIIALTMGIIPFIYTPSYLVYVTALFLLMIVLANKPYKLFSNKILSQIGKQSFSIYLVHFAVIMAYKKIVNGHIILVDSTATALLNVTANYLIIFICSFIITYFTYTYIEKKGITVGKKLIDKLSANS